MKVCVWTALCALPVLVDCIQRSSNSEADSIFPFDVEDAYEWFAWKRQHQRNYTSDFEELERYIIWRSNKLYVHYHNKYADTFGYTLRLNQFGDLVSMKLFVA